MTEKPDISAITIYVSVRMKVDLTDRGIADPDDALDKACEMVDLHTMFERVPYPHNVADVGWDGGIAGALVDFEGDEEYDNSIYVQYDPVSCYLDDEVEEALGAILASGGSPLNHLKKIAAGRDAGFQYAALWGIIRHSEATPEERTEAIRTLFKDTPYETLRSLEEDPELLNLLRPEDLASIFKSERQQFREKALLLLRHLESRSASEVASNRKQEHQQKARQY